MPATFEAIATYALPSGTNLYTFSSIPSTYTDLFVTVGNWRGSIGENSVAMYYNGDNGSNYGTAGYWTFGTGNGSSSGQTGFQATNVTGQQAYLDRISGDTTTAGQINAYISRYADTTINKTTLIKSGCGVRGTESISHIYYSTNAINSITFRMQGSEDISAGTFFTIFGIKAA